ncbi:hypothetical protein BDZ97DRAFT_1349996 [Flammula alnicola]|nr:hypothetical protein BDZ97DRAFT_1349996 [Flammula alnicola]
MSSTAPLPGRPNLGQINLAAWALPTKHKNCQFIDVEKCETVFLRFSKPLNVHHGIKTKPNLAVWLLLESLGILSHTIKPSAHRWIFFVVITSIATYAMIYTRMDFLHLGMTERGMSSRILMIVLFASTDILLCNPQKELRLVGQKENISEAPFLSRLWWGIIVWGNPRRVNFTHEPTAHIPPRPTHKTRTAFVISQFLSIAFLLLIYDLNGFMNRANPYYGKDVLVVTGYQRLWRLAGFGYCIVIYVVLMIQHKLYSIISVALRITTPRDWPALYHSLFEGYTLRRMNTILY